MEREKSQGGGVRVELVPWSDTVGAQEKHTVATDRGRWGGDR